MSKRVKKIPAIRRDIQFYPIHHNGQQWLSVYDQLGYSRPDIAFPKELESLLSFFTGYFSWDVLNQSGLGEKEMALFEALMHEMDNAGLLETAGFEQRKRELDTAFVQAETRPMICAGSVYPNNPSTLHTFFETALAHVQEMPLPSPPKGLFAPHIDFNVNLSIYAESFKPLKSVKPKHVYLIGTSHYSGLYRKYENSPFQFSLKSFQVPGRVLKNNREKTQYLAAELSEFGSTLYDISHKPEHSLELHAVWVSHIWKHDFSITPILIGSYEDTLYMHQSELERRAIRFSEVLKSVLTEDDFVLISGDLSHIGKKFGDKKTATQLYPTVEPFDRAFLQAVATQNSAELFSLMRATHDAYHVCGFPPVQSVLLSKPFTKGKQIGYAYWDEKQRDSGVSFGSVLFF